jgi:hypothetical protein
VLALIVPTIADTAYFGGITTTRCPWSTWMMRHDLSTRLRNWPV